MKTIKEIVTKYKQEHFLKNKELKFSMSGREHVITVPIDTPEIEKWPFLLRSFFITALTNNRMGKKYQKLLLTSTLNLLDDILNLNPTAPDTYRNETFHVHHDNFLNIFYYVLGGNLEPNYFLTPEISTKMEMLFSWLKEEWKITRPQQQEAIKKLDNIAEELKQIKKERHI